MIEAIALILLAIVGIKWATGIIVARKHNEFKWYYFGSIYACDLLKVAVAASLAHTLSYDWLILVLGLGLAIDLIAGVIKNAAHYDERLAARLPKEFREPARLRLGNPRNTQ